MQFLPMKTWLLTLIALAISLTSISKLTAQPTGQEENSPERKLWTTSKIVGSPEPPAPYRIQPIFQGIQFRSAVDIVKAKGTGHLFVMQLNGKVFSIDPNVDSPKKNLVIDLKKIFPDLVQALGITFHPEFETNRKVYVCIAGPNKKENGTVVSSFEVSPNAPFQFDPNSKVEIIKWVSGGHNGCCLKFGPDGMLYVSTGDATSPSPPDEKNTGQNLTDLLSCILRIDVDRTEGEMNYAIPKDNPFVKVANARPEIWAYGFRNPWRMSFDPLSKKLMVGDVGWELWEMIYDVKKGGNYGWSVMEGPQAAKLESIRGPDPITPPLVYHSHNEARSITGGFHYYGEKLPKLKGAYIYGDYATGKFWALRINGDEVQSLEEIAQSKIAIIGFGIDYGDELLILDHRGGIYQLVENKETSSVGQFPKKLSESGLFKDVVHHEVQEGVYEYSVNSEAWHDHATARRFVALKNRDQMKVGERRPWSQLQQWRMPKDSVLVKTISMQMDDEDPASVRKIETQILQFKGSGNDDCNGYTYRWNEDQTDAVLVDKAGETVELSVADKHSAGGYRLQKWRFASRNECLLCHNDTSGAVLSFKPSQLISDTKSTSNQLTHFVQMGLFDKEVSLKEPVLVDPFEKRHSLERRARSYLHVNCAHCHRFGGGGNAMIELRHDFPDEKLKLFDVRPTQGNFGLANAKLVNQGKAAESILLYRLSKLGPGRMPRSSSSCVDKKGVQLIEQWIASLGEQKSKSPARKTIERAHRLASRRNMSQAVEEILKDPNDQFELFLFLNRKLFDDPMTAELKHLVSQSSDLQLHDLFDHFIPAGERVERLGEAVDPEAILEIQGNAERGKKLILESPTIQCKNCHQYQGVGKSIGPDLDKLSSKTPKQILQSILNPSKEIAPKYLTHIVETIDGDSFSGILVTKNAQSVELMQVDGKKVAIPRADVEVLTPQNKSIMPELLIQGMTAQQVADIVEFLRASNK